MSIWHASQPRRSVGSRSAISAARRSRSRGSRYSKMAVTRLSLDPKWYSTAELLPLPTAAAIWRIDTPSTPWSAIIRSAASRICSLVDFAAAGIAASHQDRLFKSSDLDAPRGRAWLPSRDGAPWSSAELHPRRADRGGAAPRPRRGERAGARNGAGYCAHEHLLAHPRP